MSKIKITKWFPKGFAECLQGLSGQVESEAGRIAATATSYLTRGGGFHVEMSTAPRYRDSTYGVSRPVAHVVPNDTASSVEEAKNKVLSKAVGR